MSEHPLGFSHTCRHASGSAHATSSEKNGSRFRYAQYNSILVAKEGLAMKIKEHPGLGIRKISFKRESWCDENLRIQSHLFFTWVVDPAYHSRNQEKEEG